MWQINADINWNQLTHRQKLVKGYRLYYHTNLKPREHIFIPTGGAIYGTLQYTVVARAPGVEILNVVGWSWHHWLEMNLDASDVVNDFPHNKVRNMFYWYEMHILLSKYTSYAVDFTRSDHIKHDIQFADYPVNPCININFTRYITYTQATNHSLSKK